ncbi:MoxR family ATPase [Candidatus Woesearchaeota archaeon]|nr:MoxR family ATPase [Candidatus Woesearchaeota archaeon]
MAKNELALKIKKHSETISAIKAEMAKIVVGQDEVIDTILKGVLSNGHILLEGVPGIAKTLIVRSLSKIMGCEFKRIQFTPDLLPTDIVGISTYEESRGFYVLKGPIFANFILADEINRAPPKVQSALLEGMQEKQVTIGKETFSLPFPFFVLATQNPLEQLGTFPLPEAQVDRFLFKIIVTYPKLDEEQQVLKKNISLQKFESFDLKSLLNDEAIIEMQEDVKQVYLDPKIERYIVRIVDATRQPAKYKISLGRFVDWGASPRASTSMYIASKADAFLNGKDFVTPYNVKSVAHNILRHRIILNYEGQAERINTDDIIKEILSKIPVP